MDTPAYSIDHIESLVLVAGISGAGKSTAMHLLSDTGYSVVDNLPVPLLASFIQFSMGAGARYRKTALLLDIDSLENLELIAPLLNARRAGSSIISLIFLDADTQSVVRRYSETRRPHPAFDPSSDESLQDAIFREREKLQPLKERADVIFDTSGLNTHELKRRMRDFLTTLGVNSQHVMRINFTSFGFKRGVPIDCDLVADVRFLANPFFVEGLRKLNGLEQTVRDYVFKSPDADEFIKRYVDLLKFLIPRYSLEGKAYLNIGVGCTGGQHRSVAIAEALRMQMEKEHFATSIRHRDLHHGG
jgi:UPF0042 nucleotide-binding protein